MTAVMPQGLFYVPKMLVNPEWMCIRYRSSQEVAHAASCLLNGQRNLLVSPDDLQWPLLQRCLHTSDCPPVDLLIRTSGESRLSDFMLWQCSWAQLSFLEKLWPDVTYPDLVRCILAYQMKLGYLGKGRLRGIHDGQQQTKSCYTPEQQQPNRKQQKKRQKKEAKQKVMQQQQGVDASSCCAPLQQHQECNCNGFSRPKGPVLYSQQTETWQTADSCLEACHQAAPASCSGQRSHSACCSPLTGRSREAEAEAVALLNGKSLPAVRLNGVTDGVIAGNQRRQGSSSCPTDAGHSGGSPCNGAPDGHGRVEGLKHHYAAKGNHENDGGGLPVANAGRTLRGARHDAGNAACSAPCSGPNLYGYQDSASSCSADHGDRMVADASLLPLAQQRQCTACTTAPDHARPPAEWDGGSVDFAKSRIGTFLGLLEEQQRSRIAQMAGHPAGSSGTGHDNHMGI